MTESCQSTLASNAFMEGRGLHTGQECRVTVHPAEPSTGVVFVTPGGEIEALAHNVSDTKRGTSLRKGDAEVRTVEHLLAALAGMKVDNARVEVTGIEIPAAGGCALPFVEMIERAGVAPQAAEPNSMYLREAVWAVGDDKFLLALPGSGLSVHGLIDFQHPMIGRQTISLALAPEAFKRELAPARTFCTSDEIQAIRAQGLGLGGTIDNVVVVERDGFSVDLRFENEFVRHKMLDLIGDLSLIGVRLNACVAGAKTGHTLNIELANRLCQLAEGKR